MSSQQLTLQVITSELVDILTALRLSLDVGVMTEQERKNVMRLYMSLVKQYGAQTKRVIRA